MLRMLRGMFRRRQVWFVPVIVAALACLMSSCSEQRRTFVRDYPADTPFVFSNTVRIEGSLPKDEKKQLTLGLAGYWADSLIAPKVQEFLLFYKMRNPPIFDSSNISRSVTYMTAYLNSRGFYYPGFKDSVRVDTFKGQRRANILMTIDPGHHTLIDSFGYQLTDSSLQRLALANETGALLLHGKPYSKDITTAELDRLVSIYRNNGYFKLTRDNVYALADTTYRLLVRPTADPIEQAERMAQIEKSRRDSPTINIMIRQRADSLFQAEDDTVITDKPYHVGNIYYYPETRLTDIPDSLMQRTDYRTDAHREFTIKYDRGLFGFRPIREHNYLRRGELYDDRLYYKTINNFSSIGAWSEIDTRSVIRGDSVDLHFFLVPAIKQNVSYDLEVSRNTGDVISSVDLFGLSGTVTLRNRNVWRNAIQAVTSLHGGVELTFDQNQNLLQTVQASIGHTYSFPRFIAPFKVRRTAALDGVKTLLSVNAVYSDRFNFFRLRSLVTSWGYEWKSKNHIWQYKPLNIELYSLDTLPLLIQYFNTNPYLRTAFNTGSVVSQQLSYNVSYLSKTHPNVSHRFRFALEEAGGLLGLIGGLRDHIYQYVRLEGEYVRNIKLPVNSIALRAYAGIGYNYGNSRFGNTLPFFKQFIGGGPNSMRAWNLRQLGLGSSLRSDTSGYFRDRFGDMQLELNAEYRFRLLSFSSADITGALFTDVGNIWNLRRDTLNPLGQFAFDKLGRDVAIGVGTGIRLDFHFFLIRVDFGIKLKDPARLANGGWLDIPNFTWRNKEFQIVDATDPSGQRLVNRNNFAIQLGIGMPF